MIELDGAYKLKLSPATQETEPWGAGSLLHWACLGTRFKLRTPVQLIGNQLETVKMLCALGIDRELLVPGILLVNSTDGF